MINVYASIDEPRLQQLVNGMDAVRWSILQRIGYRGKQLLIRKLLRDPQAKENINMFRPEYMVGRTETRDKRGRRMFSYATNRQGTITRIKAYPLNLFENGRRGFTDPPRYVFRLKLPAQLEPEISGMMNRRMAEFVRQYG